MPLSEFVRCVTVTFKMTEQADQLHHDKAPTHSTALVQAFYGKASHHTILSAPLQPKFGSLRLLGFFFPKLKSPLKINLRMGGAICLLPLYTFITWSGKAPGYGVGKCIVMNRTPDQS